MKNDFNNFEDYYSPKDKKKNIILPAKMTEDLAEDIGIHIGDGSMYLNKNGGFAISCFGDINEDKEHYLKRIIPLKQKLFHVTIKVNGRKDVFGFTICSKALYHFYLLLGIPNGSKAKISHIPEIIKESDKNIKCAFIRGLADTDFSLMFKAKRIKYDKHHYPMISATFASERLVKDINEILRELGFKTAISKRTSKRWNKEREDYRIDINGKENLEKWMKMIGFKNPKHYTKYLIWKKYGFCEPRSTLVQRRHILSN
ncbi:MAG: hypothetical protein KJ697_00485 [Nanoarchaeota archaeon]|nr:hypothetical protein [Nanoarchaeota archaeon]MBU4124322.1 hypothetical protein [Nanoarchaeota archaeon]